MQVRQPHKELHQLEELQDALRQQLRRPGVAQQNVEVALSKFSDVGAELLVRVSLNILWRCCLCCVYVASAPFSAALVVWSTLLYVNMLVLLFCSCNCFCCWPLAVLLLHGACSSCCWCRLAALKASSCCWSTLGQQCLALTCYCLTAAKPMLAVPTAGGPCQP